LRGSDVGAFLPRAFSKQFGTASCLNPLAVLIGAISLVDFVIHALRIIATCSSSSWAR
jgi:hypothetical protein